jgi:hypothetical protein
LRLVTLSFKLVLTPLGPFKNGFIFTLDLTHTLDGFFISLLQKSNEALSSICLSFGLCPLSASIPLDLCESFKHRGMLPLEGLMGRADGSKSGIQGIGGALGS